MQGGDEIIINPAMDLPVNPHLLFLNNTCIKQVGDLLASPFRTIRSCASRPVSCCSRPPSASTKA